MYTTYICNLIRYYALRNMHFEHTHKNTIGIANLNLCLVDINVLYVIVFRVLVANVMYFTYAQILRRVYM